MPKILRIAGFKGLGGGAQEHIRILSTGLNKLGYDNIMACQPGEFAQFMKENGFRVYTVNLKDKWRSIAKIHDIIKKENIDIVHTHQYYGDKRGLIAAKLSKMPVIVTTLHQDINLDDHGNHKMNFPLWVYNRILAHIPDRLIAVSEATRKHTLEQLKIDRHRVITIHNGTDLQKIHGIKEDEKEKIRKEFCMQSDEKYIGMVARLDMQKGHKYLFEAIAKIASNIDQLKTFIVGNGYARDYLKTLARDLGIDDKITFTGMRKDALSIMSCMDVIVVPSLIEPFGRVILEAMALSKPVVVTNVGGSRECVINGKTGILVSPRDPRALASAIAKILTHNKLAAQMGALGKKRVYQYFAAETFVKKTAAVYEELYEQPLEEKIGRDG